MVSLHHVAGMLGMVALAIATVAVPATAEARDLDYRPTAGCPSADEVSRAIEERAPEGRPARITIERKTTGYRGELVLGGSDESASKSKTTMTRTVEGRSCAAVVQALALVVSLDREEAHADTDAKGGADAKADADANANANANADSGSNAPAAPPPNPDAVPVATPARQRWSAGLAAFTTTFMRGDASGLSMFLDERWDKPLFDVSFMQPSIRASLWRIFGTWETSVNHPQLETHFMLTAGSLDACPFGYSMFDEWVTGSVCGRVDVGALDADTGNGPTRTRAHVAAGGVSRARFAILPHAKYVPFVEATFALVAPLTRDTFHVLDDPTFRLPSVLQSGAIGTGVVFP
jgi:hypothetical protein